LEDLLQAEYNDLAEIPEIGEGAGSVIEAVRTEAAHKKSRKVVGYGIGKTFIQHVSA
jgi:hypothetical protein